ncbi:MAG: universal stress protein [Flavobacteriaceae bacterium]|nr:universal stress protein [Flavobacteriaceae bacterium]
MKLLEKILLATDFGKASDSVLNNAIYLAKTFQSKITVLHILPDDIENEKAKSLLIESAENHLKIANDFIKEKGVFTDESLIEFGRYSDKVVEVSEDLKVNIVLIGAGNKTKNEKFQLGNTAETIIRNSNKPVWVVKKGNFSEIKTIFCPVDFSDESKRALKNASTIARRLKAKIIVFSVYDTSFKPSVKLNWEEINEYRKTNHLAELEEFLTDFNFTDLECSVKVKGGDPAKRILKAIKKYKPELLMMGTTGKSGLSRFFMGSVTEKVVREVPCSFITLKSEDVIDLKIESRARDIHNYYETATQLIKDGYFEEAINEFNRCLKINDMYIPALSGLAKVYKKTGDDIKAKKYKYLTKDVMGQLWDRKIEDELRKRYDF